jgi:hypothetical protein
MHPTGSCKCVHCIVFFIPNARNRAKQRYCDKPDCQQESKAASQRAWSSKPANADYFKGADNVERTRVWRRAHPGYAQRKTGGRPRRRVALQVLLNPQPTPPQPPAPPDAAVALQEACVALQDDWKQQPAVLVGLVAHLTGLALQEDIDPILRSMHSRGRAILGIDVQRPDYGKTTDRSRTGAAHAAPI